MPTRSQPLDQGVFSVDPGRRLAWAHWETASSLFDPRTGETHILSVLPAEVLRLLESSPQRLPELAAQLAKLCNVDNSPDWEMKVQGIVRDLISLDIVDYQPNAA